MPAILGRLVIYTKRTAEMAAFYGTLFGFRTVERAGDRIVELEHPDGGAAILLHPAAKGQKEGQRLVKLVFDVEDVPKFCAEAAARGVQFGPIHQADGYAFANTTDPSGNSVSISSRAFAGTQ